MYTGIILIDLQKVFDNLDHKILLETVSCLDFNSSVIDWFESYLSSENSSYLWMIFSRRLQFQTEELFRGLFCGHSCFWYILMIFPNHYQKVTLAFMLMILAFSIKKKAFTKSKMFLLKELSTLCEWFVDNKLTQNLSFFVDKTNRLKRLLCYVVIQPHSDYVCA